MSSISRFQITKSQSKITDGLLLNAGNYSSPSVGWSSKKRHAIQLFLKFSQFFLNEKHGLRYKTKRILYITSVINRLMKSNGEVWKIKQTLIFDTTSKRYCWQRASYECNSRTLNRSSADFFRSFCHLFVVLWSHWVSWISIPKSYLTNIPAVKEQKWTFTNFIEINWSIQIRNKPSFFLSVGMLDVA